MFDAKLENEKEKGTWVVHGGVSFWENMRVHIKLREEVEVRAQ
jgi:hypothetical protein